jgi:hypothetical protein
MGMNCNSGDGSADPAQSAGSPPPPPPRPGRWTSATAPRNGGRPPKRRFDGRTRLGRRLRALVAQLGTRVPPADVLRARRYVVLEAVLEAEGTSSTASTADRMAELSALHDQLGLP